MKHYLWNMMTIIKNGQLARKSIVYQKRKNICESILKILWNEGFIAGYKISESDNSKFLIFLKYGRDGEPVVNSLKFLSKPSKRFYYSAKQLWKLDSSKLFLIISTNKGLMTIDQCKKNNIGGEPIVVIK